MYLWRRRNLFKWENVIIKINCDALNKMYRKLKMGGAVKVQVAIV